MEERKVILYICMSLDGFIATQDDDISWLSVVEKEGETIVETVVVEKEVFKQTKMGIIFVVSVNME